MSPCHVTYIHLFREHGDVISFGALDLSLQETFLCIGDPHILLTIERPSLLLCHLFTIDTEVLKVGIVDLNPRHVGGCQGCLR